MANSLHCNACDLDFVNYFVALHHRDALRHWECECCNKLFDDEYVAEEHMNFQNHRSNRYCLKCQKGFVNVHSYEKHMISDSHSLPVVKPSSPLPLECEFCKIVFTNPNHLAAHLDISVCRNARTFSSSVPSNTLQDRTTTTPKEYNANNLKEGTKSLPREQNTSAFQQHNTNILKEHNANTLNEGNKSTPKEQNSSALPQHSTNTFKEGNKSLPKERNPSAPQQPNINLPPQHHNITPQKPKTTTLEQPSTGIPRPIRLPGLQAEPLEYTVTVRTWNGTAFECYLCNAEFSALGSLIQHLQSPRHKKPYRCPHVTCNKPYGKLASLFRHLESETCGYVRFE